jgi:hypothetical protein
MKSSLLGKRAAESKEPCAAKIHSGMERQGGMERLGTKKTFSSMGKENVYSSCLPIALYISETEKIHIIL